MLCARSAPVDPYSGNFVCNVVSSFHKSGSNSRTSTSYNRVRMSDPYDGPVRFKRLAIPCIAHRSLTSSTVGSQSCVE